MTATDNAFRALTDGHCRTLLVDLLAATPQVAGAGPPGGRATDVTVAEYRQQTAMYHVHLPKLERYGYIEWDRDADEVTRGPLFDDLRPLLEVAGLDRED